MTGTAVQLRFEDILSRVRQPARLIGEESGAGPGFGRELGELRVALGFPETYEIGISNQAIQILYHLARGAEGIAVERTYLPWVDAMREMRRDGIPLLTLESWSPVREADVLGVTLQYEFNYSNLLEMLDLALIPLLAAERGEDDPIVVAGGPAVANFLPLSRFLDAVAVGDGEAIFREILQVLSEGKREGLSRYEAKSRLARIQGVYVPGISTGVTRRALPRLAGAPYPGTCLVPLTAGVHDRAWVEIMRGCTRGCRFCQAGMWYRPVRERTPEEVMAIAEEQLARSGHQELALASLSTTDYTSLNKLLAETAGSHPEVRVSLPSLRVDTAAVRLARLASPTGPSLTLAPEAGSQRMWDIMNKNVTREDVLAAVEEAFRSGRTTLKLYFMIGLPLETDADVVALADLCLELRDLGRRVLDERAPRLQLNVSVNNFVPKPFTPFQWCGMADRETLVRRQGLLRSRLRKRGVKLTLHDIDKSYLEAALARGGEEMGAVIERAWQLGARYDSWTEQFRGDAWAEALASVGTSAESLAVASIPKDAPLPWDTIGGVVKRDFLWEEWQRAVDGTPTEDCRWGECSDCGACVAPPGNDLATRSANDLAGRAAEDLATKPAEELARKSAEELARRSADDPSPPSGARSGELESGEVVVTSAPARARDRVGRQRYVLTFSVTGKGRFVGHLDRVEMFRRAVRRAGGRLALSEGLRPKPLLSLALPLAVGWEGLQELCEFELAEEPPPEFFERLGSVLPGHLSLLALDRHTAQKSLPSRVTGAEFEVELHVPTEEVRQSVDPGRLLTEAAARYAAAPTMPVEDRRAGKVRTIDVKRYVERLAVETVGPEHYALTFRAAVTPSGTARPERIVEAVSALSGLNLETTGITRTRIELT